MAHANLHMAAGMAVATAVMVWPVVTAWRSEAPLARPVARLLLSSYVLGLWALIPNLATSAGFSPSIHRAGWANVFLGHAWIDERNDGGLLIGELVMVAIFAFHYGVLVLALARARRLRDAATAGAARRDDR
jgi:hypothetical protein